MERVSSNLATNNSNFYLRRHERSVADQTDRITQQTKILELGDDPSAASRTVQYDSYLKRLQRYEENTLYASDHYAQVDGYLQNANEILQHVRELTVQGATGTYAPEDLKYMGIEMNEMLKELITIANATGSEGTKLFAGDKVFTEPFRMVEGSVPGGNESMVTRVEYRGAGANRTAEISENTFANLDVGGGEVFWAEKMQIFSTYDASNYRVENDASIFVDGQEIFVSPGDTVNSIVAKINDSPAPVKAYVDPETRGIALEGTTAHLIKLEDQQGSTVLQDLGLINFNSDANAPNWNPSARVSGGSMFDMIIRVRDALFRGDSDFIGSQGIGGMDLALNNMGGKMAEVGARMNRVDQTWNRLNEEIPNVTKALDREQGIDMATAITDLKMMELAHKAALQTTARINQQTLMDFLR
ncbi:MAG: flagellar hook-associated protein 3 [Treponema sp.]|jgi:flagellar hook-associated protein 3 FlgL|nr:flagellar hook-associated protein 3 [Treponema sp.]